MKNLLIDEMGSLEYKYCDVNIKYIVNEDHIDIYLYNDHNLADVSFKYFIDEDIIYLYNIEVIKYENKLPEIVKKYIIFFECWDEYEDEKSEILSILNFKHI